MTHDELLAALGAFLDADPTDLVTWIDRRGAHGADICDDAIWYARHRRPYARVETVELAGNLL